MKRLFDKNARARSFKSVDKVLMLLPIPGSALQACYSGPYVIKEKANDCDYIVVTSRSRRRNRLCHINLFKPYLEGGSVPLPPFKEEIITVLSLSIADTTDAQFALACSDVENEEVTSPSSAVVG